MNELSHMQNLLADGSLPDSWFVEFVFKNLVDVDESEYELSEVLRADALEVIFRIGEQHLKNEGRGSMWRIDTGKVVDLSYLAPMFRKLFERWQSRKWIRIGEDESVTRTG